MHSRYFYGHIGDLTPLSDWGLGRQMPLYAGFACPTFLPHQNPASSQPQSLHSLRLCLLLRLRYSPNRLSLSHNRTTTSTSATITISATASPSLILSLSNSHFLCRHQSPATHPTSLGYYIYPLKTSTGIPNILEICLGVELYSYFNFLANLSLDSKLSSL